MGTRTIKTRYGDLRGALVEFLNQTHKPVEAFRGLQYGTTYAGRMRFMPPTSPLERWKYTRLAFSMRPICPQKNYKEEDLSKDLPKPTVIGIKRASPFNLVQSEDCLSLNIYVPVQGKLMVIRLCMLRCYHLQLPQTAKHYDCYHMLLTTCKSVSAFKCCLIVTFRKVNDEILIYVRLQHMCLMCYVSTTRLVT
ncbi:hypothetical protein ACJMK2_017843 [Sinanodonta woodiana]|uniref:Carboxylesterase type B domain-containing protein n=1 Tax=Sinanodonta woodiana TaxID=1069815 RepID=A0ABD3UBP1_SINWO